MPEPEYACLYTLNPTALTELGLDPSKDCGCASCEAEADRALASALARHRRIRKTADLYL